MDLLHQVVEKLQKTGRLVLLSHVLPDGDCIGSMLALGKALRALGKEVTMVNSDPIPEYLTFLPLAETVRLPEEVKDWPSVAVCLDCSDMARLGEGLSALVRDKTLVNIDHHVSNTQFGAVNYVHPDAAATGQLVADIIDALGVPWDRELGVLIYTAIATDTGSFQYSSTTVSVHLLAAKLIGTGLDVAAVNQSLYETKSLASVKLLGRALDRLEMTPDHRVAWISLDRATLQRLGAKDEHTEGIINFTRAIDTVEVGMLFREIAPGKVKVGLRSKQLVDVNKLAAVFGGGGHQRAAGCLIEGELGQVVPRVISIAKEFVEALDERHY